jgi:hypothetical protein
MDLLKVFTWEEDEVFEQFSEAIKEKPTLTDGSNYAFWDRSSPFIVQAHIDVVTGGFKGQEWDKEKKEWIKHKDVGKMEVIRKRNLITSKVGILGGDDRAGIMAILAINFACIKKKLPMPSILLTNGEESGGTGMKKFVGVIDKKMFDSVRLIIGLDRRGCGEYVTYIDPDTEVKSYIESFGFNKSYGSYSDSKDLSRFLNIPHVNLSVGYYDNHSSKETVHLDETFLTATRVCEMIKDPIIMRYKIEEEKVYGGYVPLKKYNYLANYGKSATDTAKITTEMEKRRNRCDKLQKDNKLPKLCANYPYLDYLLTDKDIIEGFHVVSSTKNKGKTIEEWAFIFSNKSDDSISKLWKKEFGNMEKIYIKSSAEYKYYLAVKFVDLNDKCARSAAGCEWEEDQILKKSIELAHAQAEADEKKRKEDDLIIDAEVSGEDFAMIHGYCTKFSSGECSGGCHGNRHYCTDTQDPPRMELYF